MKHGLETYTTPWLEVRCHILILEFSQPEYSILSYRIEISESSICVQSHHSLGMCFEYFILKRIKMFEITYLLIPHVIVFLRDI